MRPNGPVGKHHARIATDGHEKIALTGVQNAKARVSARTATADAKMLDEHDHQVAQGAQDNAVRKRKWREQLGEDVKKDPQIGFGTGLKTGFQAVGNAGVDTVINFFTIGFFNSNDLFGHSVFGGEGEMGYNASYRTARVAMEFLFAVSSGGTSLLTKFGWIRKIGFVSRLTQSRNFVTAQKIIQRIDILGNIHESGKSGKVLFIDGQYTFWNWVRFFGSGLSLYGNFKTYKGLNGVEAPRGAKGLLGADLEDWILKNRGGSGGFKSGGRQIDGKLPDGTWYEAKSAFNYLFGPNGALNPQKWNEFTSQISFAAAQAKKNGASFKLITNVKPPQKVIDWLTKRGIPWEVIE